MCRAIASTRNMSEKEWLDFRRKGIGGSDAGAIAGVSPWASPLDVYLEKIGESPESDFGEPAYWGNVLEDVVAKEFQKRTGLKVQKRNAILQHSDHPWMLANVDRLIVGEKIGLECKTTNAFLKSDWDEDKIPDHYLLQCAHYMAVTGLEAWYIAVLIGGNTFKFKRIERDEDLINNLIQVEKSFWENYVLAKEMPEPDGSAAATKLLGRLYSDSTKTTIELPNEADSLISEYQEYGDMEKRYKTLKDESSNKLKAMLENNEIGITADHKVTWKGVSTARFDSKTFKENHGDLYKQYVTPTTSRRFAIK